VVRLSVDQWRTLLSASIRGAAPSGILSVHGRLAHKDTRRTRVLQWGCLEEPRTSRGAVRVLIREQPLAAPLGCSPEWGALSTFFFFFFTLVTGPRRSLSLKLSDTKSLCASVPALDESWRSHAFGNALALSSRYTTTRKFLLKSTLMKICLSRVPQRELLSDVDNFL